MNQNSFTRGLLGLLVLLVACNTPDPPPSSNHAPTASFVTPASGTALQPLVFDASLSSDPDQDSLVYSWDFGDGVHGGGVKIAHQFALEKTFTVKLTVSDGKLMDSKTQQISISSLPTASKTVTLSGLVTDTSGAKLEGVKVEVVGGSSSVFSDANGNISLPNVGLDVPLEFKLSKLGFADAFKPFKLPASAVNADAFFTAALMARESAQTLDSSGGGTVVGKDAAKLELPANALVDASGQAVSGTVSVSLTPVNVTDPNGVQGFPGSFTGIKPDGSSSLIVSHGTVEFVLEKDGKRLNLAPGVQASIDIPIYTNANLDGSSLKVGDEIPLWSLNEQSLDWVQEGTGVVQTSSGDPSKLVLRAKVSHFSWWNADMLTNPGNPDPKCIYDTDIGIPGANDTFATAQICNMLADIDRGLNKNSRQQAPILPAFHASTTIPIAGGVAVAVPADVNLILRGYVLNGTWSGETHYRATKGSSDEVLIKMRPIGVTVGGNTEAIVAPWSKDYVINSSLQTDTFLFSVLGGESQRLRVSSANISSLEGTAQLKIGNQVISTSSFAPNKDAVFQVDPQIGSDYKLEIVANKNTPGGYHLKLEKVGSESIASLPFFKQLNPSGLDTGDVYQYHFVGQANDLVRIMFHAPYPNLGGITLLHNAQILESQQITGSGGGDARFNFTLPETGDYVLQVADARAYTISLQIPTHVSLNSNTNLNLSSAFQTPSFVFDGSKDTVVSLGAAYSSIAGSVPQIARLTAPDGTQLLDFFSDGSFNRLVKALPTTGLYTVDLEPSLPNPSLNTTLTFGISSVNPPTPITPNSSVAGAFTMVGSRAFYSLNLQAGDLIRLSAKAPDTLGLDVWLSRPVGQFFDFSSGILDQLTVAAGKQNASLPYMVLQSGTYMLELQSNAFTGTVSQQTGSFSLNILEPTPINLSLDTAVNGNTNPFEFSTYTLNLPQTGYINLAALETTNNLGNTIKPVVYDSNHQRLSSLDSLGFVKQLQAGVYTVAVNLYNPGALNLNDSSVRGFTLGAATLEPPIDMDFVGNALKNGSLDVFVERDYYSFDAVQNQHVTITVTSLDGLALTVGASPPFNGDFTIPAGGGCQIQIAANSSAKCAFTPSSTGKYVIFVQNATPLVKQTGQYSVQLQQP